MKRSVFIVALLLLLLSLLTSCIPANGALPQYTPSGKPDEEAVLNDPSFTALSSFDGFSATREPIKNKVGGISERFEVPTVSKGLLADNSRVIVHGDFLYYCAKQNGRTVFCRASIETGAVEAFSPPHTDGLLLCFAVVGDENAPYIFYAENTVGGLQKEGTPPLKSDVWSTGLYAFDIKTEETYTIIEDCAAIHRIHSFAVSGDRIYLSAAIYALNTESGLITTANALLSVSPSGGNIDVLIMNDDSADAFFLSGGDIAITSFRITEASPTGKGRERVIRIDTDSGEVSIRDLPEALCGAGWRTVIGDSVYFHRDDDRIYRLPLCDLSGEPLFVAEIEAEILMYTDKALYVYDWNEGTPSVDLSTFCRISTDGTRERVFGNESIKICETVLEQDGILYCRTTGDAYLIAIDLASGTYTTLVTTESVS
ncbi:MAG: hypothetical protein IKC26_07095 [Clostridia bacterium]|nr:hypothetical protein [Clostridia bacterium]